MSEVTSEQIVELIRKVERASCDLDRAKDALKTATATYKRIYTRTFGPYGRRAKGPLFDGHWYYGYDKDGEEFAKILRNTFEQEPKLEKHWNRIVAAREEEERARKTYKEVAAALVAARAAHTPDTSWQKHADEFMHRFANLKEIWEETIQPGILKQVRDTGQAGWFHGYLTRGMVQLNQGMEQLKKYLDGDEDSW